MYWPMKVSNDEIRRRTRAFYHQRKDQETEVVLIDSLFAPGLDHVEKADLCKGYWNSGRKSRVATHVFEITGLESQQKNAQISIFSF